MAPPDDVQHRSAELLGTTFADLIARGEVDVVAMPGASEVEVQADDWTLVLKGFPLEAAWIALDESPVSHAEQMAALVATITLPELTALRDADRRLDGALIIALVASGDPLSEALAVLLGANRQRDEVPI